MKLKDHLRRTRRSQLPSAISYQDNFCSDLPPQLGPLRFPSSSPVDQILENRSPRGDDCPDKNDEPEGGKHSAAQAKPDTLIHAIPQAYTVTDPNERSIISNNTQHDAPLTDQPHSKIPPDITQDVAHSPRKLATRPSTKLDNTIPKPSSQPSSSEEAHCNQCGKPKRTVGSIRTEVCSQTNYNHFASGGLDPGHELYANSQSNSTVSQSLPGRRHAELRVPIQRQGVTAPKRLPNSKAHIPARTVHGAVHRQPSEIGKPGHDLPILSEEQTSHHFARPEIHPPPKSSLRKQLPLQSSAFLSTLSSPARGTTTRAKAQSHTHARQIPARRRQIEQAQPYTARRWSPTHTTNTAGAASHVYETIPASKPVYENRRALSMQQQPVGFSRFKSLRGVRSTRQSIP